MTPLEPQDVRAFFANSDLLDYMVLRPLDHVLPNWDITWSNTFQRYESAEGSYADALNRLIEELSTTHPPKQYHDSEDRLAEHVLRRLNWPIKKVGKRWVGAEYRSIVEQGGFGDDDQAELLLAAAGRLRAALVRGQRHFDDMEESHQSMLGIVLSVILYHRS